jgi:hypothetical protein
MFGTETLMKLPLALAAATLLAGVNQGPGALFASDTHALKAVAELGGAWRSRPKLVDIPRPRPPAFMPYQFDKRRAVFLHRSGDGQLNRIVLSDLGCWAEDRERALRAVLRISDARPEALHNLKFAASNVFDHDTKVQAVQAAPRLRMVFQRSNRKSRCAIDIVRTVAASI